MSVDALPWQTGITRITPNEIQIRGYRLTELIGRVSFAEAVYLLFKGDLPTAEQARLLEAILLSVIDHGVTPPSTQAARTVVCTGAPLVSAVAAGILAISEYHGGGSGSGHGALLRHSQAVGGGRRAGKYRSHGARRVQGGQAAATRLWPSHPH
ncbi:MAG TPA: hypothetical protein EYP49_06115 [Anaerolineae bacterium]|nr:hypothetical protein [Anaerolineae bacterium]